MTCCTSNVNPPTRFRGYDGTQLTSSLSETIALHVLSQESAQDTKVAEDDNSELRALRSFVATVNPEEPDD